MNQKVCYKISGLLKLLPDFYIKKTRLILSDEDGAEGKFGYFMTNRVDVTSVEKYYSLWISQTVTFADGTSMNFKSNNVNSHDKTLLRINKNAVISPVLNISGNYVESTEDFREWLAFNNISQEDLDAITEYFDVSTVIEYPGVPTPYKGNSSWGYSSETLKLEEKEILTVLNGIEDELLRKKIEYILYARVFKKHY